LALLGGSSVGRVPLEAGLISGSLVEDQASAWFEPGPGSFYLVLGDANLPYFVYIIQSETSLRYYCGSTDCIERRLQQHNDPTYTGSKTTKRFTGPWRLVCVSRHESRSEAMKHERRVKKRGINRYLLENAELVESRWKRD